MSTELNQPLLLGTDPSKSRLFGCLNHKLNFTINNQNEIVAAETHEQWRFPQEVLQIIPLCRQNVETCCFYLRTANNQVFEWMIHSNQERDRKRLKVDDQNTLPPNFSMIAENVHQIIPFDQRSIAFILDGKVQRYNTEKKVLKDTLFYNAMDSNISCQQFVQDLDTSLASFFSLGSLSKGLLYGTKEGFVYVRNFDKSPFENTKIITFDTGEKILHVELLSESLTPNQYVAIVAIGEQGTITVYSKTPETDVDFKQFNIQAPILAIQPTENKAEYLIASGRGSVSLLKIKISVQNIELESTIVNPTYKNVKTMRISDLDNRLFDTIYELNGNLYYRSSCSYKPVNLTDDEENIKAAIEQALGQLESSELAIKELDEKEQQLNEKLITLNRTLYALRSINKNRKASTVHTLDSTGFEFSLCPLIFPQSIANASLHSTSYIRLCIKTSRFLELENWDLRLELIPHQINSNNVNNQLGQAKLVPVMGFEPFYENGIEKYTQWERDIEINLDTIKLPMEISATLMLTTDQLEQPPLLFPLSTMVMDDLHYAIPCSPSLVTGIERRGLDDVSQRLAESFHKQKLHDKSGRYPWARLLRDKSSKDKTNHKSLSKLLNYREVHILCTVDLHMTDKSYRSILSGLLNEGRSNNDVKSILQSAELAVFTLAAFPGIPVIIKLTRTSSTLIDISIKCVYLPALFKTEAALLRRLYRDFLVDKKQENSELELLEDIILQLQEHYQNSENQMDIDGNNDTLTDQLKKAIDVLYEMHHRVPIGHLNVNAPE